MTIMAFAVCIVLSLVLGWLIPELISNAMHGKTNIGFIFQHRQSKIISKSQNSRLVNSGRMLLAAGIDSAQKANPVSTWSHRVPKCEILWLQRSRTQIFGEIFLGRRSWRDFWSNCSLWLTHEPLFHWKWVNPYSPKWLGGERGQLPEVVTCNRCHRQCDAQMT